MRSHYGYHGHYSRRQLRAAARYDRGPRPRSSPPAARGALMALLALAALLVIASLI